MTDQTIPAGVSPDEAKKAREWALNALNKPGASTTAEKAIARLVLNAVPEPRPTLADMTLDEQDECTGMQADLAQGDRVRILDGTPDHDGLVQVLEKSLDVYRPSPEDVTPRPDLPRLEWPGDTPHRGPKVTFSMPAPAPAPTLPGRWRFADDPDYGRVIVTNPTPDSDGRVYYVFPDDGAPMGFDWLFGDPDYLTYIDSPTTEEVDTPTGPSTLAVGTVIESADDPRLAALPVGSIMLDRDGETAINRGEAWTGDGYTPIPSEGAEFGPWTVLHIPKEADQ